MAWVSVHQQIINHRKTRDLFRRLKITRQAAIGYLVLIWLWALDNADRDGRLLSTTVSDIEEAGYWVGEPGVLYHALVDSRWIDEKNGGIYLHDWDEFNKPFYQYIDRKEKDKLRKREGKSARNSVENPQENPQEFHESHSPSPNHKEVVVVVDARAREGKMFQFFNQNIGPITPFQSEVLSQHLNDGIDPEMITAVMQDSVGKNDRWAWIKRTLEVCVQRNINTLELYNANKVERKNAKSRDKPQQSKQKSRAEQRMEAIEKARQEAYRMLDEEGIGIDDTS
jgi:hypothetical protein